jgi:hypothetical protein
MCTPRQGHFIRRPSLPRTTSLRVREVVSS